MALSPELVPILNMTGLQKDNNRLYQVILGLINNLTRTEQSVGVIVAGGTGGGGGGSTTSTTTITNIFQQQLNFGDTGSGEDGSPGPPGPQGNPGISGSTGSVGPIGPAVFLTAEIEPEYQFPIPGIQGPAGNQGIQGNIGNDGPAVFLTALDGIDGEPFPIPGPQGPIGNTGLTGLTGNDGPAIFLTAVDGDQGDQGFPGPQGPLGLTGPTGAAGPIGAAVYLVEEVSPEEPIRMPGVQGPQGNTGNTGASGVSPVLYTDLTDYSQETSVLHGPIINNLENYLNYQDQKAQNTNGGTFTSGAWQTRTINTEVSDVSNLGTLASNQITLVPGRYIVSASAPAFAVNQNQTRLQNVTDATTVLTGTNAYSDSVSAGAASYSTVRGVFTIAAGKALELQHQCSTTHTNNGFGPLMNFTTEVYSVIEFWKIA